MTRVAIILLVAGSAFAAEIHVDALSGRKAISPHLYGRNNSLCDDPKKPLSAKDWQFPRDAGVRMLRESGGNNATKYNWDNDRIRADGRYYVWLEYFIKRIAEEQQASGVRLLDVLDIHFYPSETKPEDIVQLHRVWFDESYNYPGANGVRRLGASGYDRSITKEYILTRCRRWLDQYLDPNHGVTLGVTEMGINGDNPNVTAVWYASTLGVFANEGVEMFLPWSWKTGMWEVLHLLSRYGQAIRVEASSDNDELVSAYASVNADLSAMTVVLVNRSLSGNTDGNLAVANFPLGRTEYEVLRLSGLPSTETFHSHTDNAIQEDTAAIEDGVMRLALPPLSVSAILLWNQPADDAADPNS